MEAYQAFREMLWREFEIEPTEEIERLFLLAGSVITAQAEEYKGKDGWKAEFAGEAIDSNFTSSAFAEEISSLQPGDSIEIKVAVKNSSEEGTDWYMSNEVLQSLEDSSPAKGGAYRYELVWNGNRESKILYSSDSVGGENVTPAGEGLHEATDNLEQFFYLDHLSWEEEGYITLKVSLNGETQGKQLPKHHGTASAELCCGGYGRLGAQGRRTNSSSFQFCHLLAGDCADRRRKQNAFLVNRCSGQRTDPVDLRSYLSKDGLEGAKNMLTALVAGVSSIAALLALFIILVKRRREENGKYQK